jgi:hypothetical protein
MNAEELEAKFKSIDENVKPGVAQIALDPAGRLKINAAGHGIGLAPPKPVLDLDINNVEVSDDYIRDKIAYAIKNPKNDGIPDVVIRELDPAGGLYELAEDYTYQAKDGYRISAKSGFKFDRASIPRIFWVIISKDDLSNVAPLFHDMLYRFKGVLPQEQVVDYREFKKSDADNLFYEIMLKRNVKKWRAYLAYQAVSKFAGFAWGTGPG